MSKLEIVIWKVTERYGPWVGLWACAASAALVVGLATLVLA